MRHDLPHPGAPPVHPAAATTRHGNVTVTTKAASPAEAGAFGDDGLTFGDVLDVLNPLHHIPVLGNIYRKISGDTIAPAARIGGGALFGGPLGAAVAAATVVAASIMGREGSALEDPGNAAPDGAVPGGWMVAAARPAREPATPAGPAPAGDAGRAITRTLPAARGGWMVAAARAAPPAAGRATSEQPANVVANVPGDAQPAPAAARAEPPAVRRGGWMVAAAYAVTDSMRREENEVRGARLEDVA